MERFNRERVHVDGLAGLHGGDPVEPGGWQQVGRRVKFGARDQHVLGVALDAAREQETRDLAAQPR